ncbi:MAG: hypothetical protein RSA55_01950, partial [Clostridia bacterium]
MRKHSQEPFEAPSEPYADEVDFETDGVPYEQNPAYRMPSSDDADFDVPKKRSIFKPRLTKPNFIFS